MKRGLKIFLSKKHYLENYVLRRNIIFEILLRGMDYGREKIFYNALNLASETSINFLAKAKSNLSSYENAWQANKNEFERLGIEEKTLIDFFEKKKKINPEEEFKKLEKSGIKLILSNPASTCRRPSLDLPSKRGGGEAGDDDYPALLCEISWPPAGLYVKTKADLKDLFSSFSLAMVGTRKATAYGREAGQKISFDLARAGVTIVSGLAWGIDAISHKAALDAHGKTIAVLGSDVNNVYPSMNQKLAKEIVEKGGALLSEYPLNSPALPYHFPQRNRIVSGLSRGVIVIEAPIKSGALITAGFALEQNRDVFAVPSSIFAKNSAGCNLLIKNGAKLVASAEDILEEYGDRFQGVLKLDAKGKPAKIFDSPQEEKVFNIINEADETDLEKIIEKAGLDVKDIIAILSVLEIKGYVKNICGRYRAT